MSDGDTEPSILPTAGCLRQIKYEYKQSQYYHNHPILDLWSMTTVFPYNGLIRHIALYPFYLHYWSPAQDRYYESYSKLKPTIMSLDATGSIVKETGPSNDKIVTKHIFLYSGVLYDTNNGKCVPIMQMLSENQSLNTIYKWLEAWLAKKKSSQRGNSG